MLKKLAFMHLIATYLLFLMDWAYKTSENVPSPFLDIKRYSILKEKMFQLKFLINLAAITYYAYFLYLIFIIKIWSKNKPFYYFTNLNFEKLKIPFFNI